jgi:hypothetical protein
LIESAYQVSERLGLALWTEDEAGPFQTIPRPGDSWQPAGHPAHVPHEYIRNGTAKLLTLFHPADGQVQVKGATSATNDVLHTWLKEELTAILATITPVPLVAVPAVNRALWHMWCVGHITAERRKPPGRSDRPGFCGGFRRGGAGNGETSRRDCPSPGIAFRHRG